MCFGGGGSQQPAKNEALEAEQARQRQEAAAAKAQAQAELEAQRKEQLEREKEQQASAAANAEITRNQRRRQAGLYQGLGATLGPSGQSLGRSIRPSSGRSSLLTGSKGGIGYRSRF